MSQDTTSVLNLVVLFTTAVVVTWYTWETRQLRLATLRQTSLQIRPFLAIEYGEGLMLWVHNLGNGVARDIKIHDVHLGEGAEGAESFLSYRWKPIDFIPRGEKRELQGEGVFVTEEERAERVERMKPWMANFGPSGKGRYEFIIDYRDLTGTNYRTALRVHQGHTESVRDVEQLR